MRLIIPPPAQSGRPFGVWLILQEVLKHSNVLKRAAGHTNNIPGMTGIGNHSIQFAAGLYSVEFQVNVLNSTEDTAWRVYLFKNGAVQTGGTGNLNAFRSTHYVTSGRQGHYEGTVHHSGFVVVNEDSDQYRWEMHREHAENEPQAFSRILDSNGFMKIEKLS